MREELTRAITSVHSNAQDERLGYVTQQVTLLHNMLETLKDVAMQQRDHVRNVEEMLIARAKQGTVELELTQEMLQNEKVFLERVQQVLAEAQQPASPPTDNPAKP